MRDDEPRRRQAWRQAVWLAVVLLAASAWAVLSHERPVERDELKIPVASLRSQAGVLALSTAQAGGPLPPRFVRAQATQLAKGIAQSRAQLDGLHLPPALEPARRQARPAADALAAAAQALQSPTAPPPDGVTAAHRVRDALKALEDSLRGGG